MGRKKAVSNKKSGGGLNTIGGPLIPEKLYDLNYTGKIQGLKKIYDKKIEKTEEELNKISKDLKDMRDVKNNEDEKIIHLTEVRNIKKTAKILGLDRNTLKAKMKLMNIKIKAKVGRPRKKVL